MLRFAEGLRQEKLSARQVFSLCDPDNTASIKYSVLHKFIELNIKLVFKDRDKFALTNFLDFRKLGYIEKPIFIRELKKAEEILSDPEKRKNIYIDDKKRLEEEFQRTKQDYEKMFGATGTQDTLKGIADFFNKTESRITFIPKNQELNDSEVKEIIKKLERHEGYSNFFAKLADASVCKSLQDVTIE